MTADGNLAADHGVTGIVPDTVRTGKNAAGNIEQHPSKHIVITSPLFGTAFGMAGLSGTWRSNGQQWTTAVGNLIAGASGLLLVALSIPWAIQLLRRESQLSAELSDPSLGPSIPELAITAMLLSATLDTPSGAVGRPLVALFAFLTIASGFAVAAAWVATRLPLNSYHPGFYLPTAGATWLSAQCVVDLGWKGCAQTLFFVGLLCWLSLGVITSIRLARAPLAAASRPVLAIEVAAPALAGNAYLVVFGKYDGFALTLAAVTAVMALVQIGLIPYYRRASFGPVFWTASFSYATAATLALRWINHEQLDTGNLWRAITLTLATGVILLLAATTLSPTYRGRFFPRMAPSVPDHRGSAPISLSGQSG